jgi:hypothetical protein
MNVILATQEPEIRRLVFQRQPRKIVHEPPSQKYPTQEGLVEIDQVVEGLSSKHETWNSNTRTTHTHTHTHKNSTHKSQNLENKTQVFTKR